MTDRYQPLRDAIAAGPTPGPWLRHRGKMRIEGSPTFYSVHDERGFDVVFWSGFDRYESKSLKARNSRYIAAADPSTIAELLAERNHLADECHEQARLLGMSGSREAKLLAERDALRAAIERHRHDLWGSSSVDHSDDVRLYAALARLNGDDHDQA